MILLSGHSLTPASKVPIESMSLRLRERDSTAEITMAGGDLYGIAVNSWMQDDDGTVWRVRSIQHEYADSTIKIQLEHVVLALKDPILFGEITPATITGDSSATTCTALQAITYILAQHPDWTLGTYGYGTVTNAYKFDGDNLYDALERVCNTLDDPWWTLDTSVYPFQISIGPKQSGVACELRADRNLSAITRTVDMSGCYTRFYPIGKGDLHISGGGYVSLNEGTYGVISKVETDQSLETEAQLRAWANERLGKHAEPTVTVRAQGIDLAEATGEPLDQLTLGRICRVPLPEYNTTILDRITELYYPDLLRAPESVEITMANRTEDITRIVANEIKTGGGRSGSGGRRAARVEEKIQEFDNSDLWINRDSVWAVSGAYTVVTDALGNKHIRLNDGSLLEVMRDGVYETVGTSVAIAEVEDTVTNTIMGSALWTQRNNITGVVGEFDVVGSGANRRLVIKSGGGLKIERNNVEYGVYDSGNLDAGVIVEMLSNGTTTTKIKADYITLDGEAVADSLINEELYINNKLDVGGYFSYQASDVGWCSFIIDGVTYDEPMFLGTGDLSFSVADTQVCQALVSAAGQITGRWSQIHSGDTYSPVYTASTSQDSESITVGVSSNGWAGISAGHPGSCIVYATAGGANRAHISISGDEPYQRGYIDGGGGSSSTIRGSWNGDTYTVTGGSNALSTTVAFNNGGWVAPAVGESANNYTRNISVKADGTDTVLTQTISASAVYDIGANSVDFNAFTFSGDTHIVTTRTMYANISNGKRKGLENQLLLDYNSDNGQEGWFGSAPNYQKYVFWRTAAEGTTGWSSRMRGTINGSWVYNKGYSDGQSGAAPAISIDRGTRTGINSGPSPSSAVQIWSGSGSIPTDVKSNGFYTFKVTAGGSTKWYYFIVNV